MSDDCTFNFKISSNPFSLPEMAIYQVKNIFYFIVHNNDF